MSKKNLEHKINIYLFFHVYFFIQKKKKNIIIIRISPSFHSVIHDCFLEPTWADPLYTVYVNDAAYLFINLIINLQPYG